MAVAEWVFATMESIRHAYHANPTWFSGNLMSMPDLTIPWFE